MPLSGLRPGNFHQLRNYLGISSAKFLQFHTGVIHGKVVGARRWNLLPLATNIEGWYQKTHNTNFNLNNRNRTIGSAPNINNSDLHGYKPIHCYNVQETISDNKIIDRPAVLLVFDIETTGLSRNKDRIIEIAIRDLIGGKNSTFETLINPGIHVANEDVHGISSRMVNRPDVPRFEEAIPILLQYVKSRQVVGKPVLLFAHSGRKFDVPFIIREFERCSMKVPDDWLFVDTLPIARQLLNPDGSKRASSKLQVLREHFGIPLEGSAHRAMQDVITLSLVLQRLTFELKLTVPELMAKGFRASDITKVTLR